MKVSEMRSRVGAKERGGDRRGGVLVLALLAVVVVTCIAGSFLELSSAVTKRQESAVDQKKSFYLAEAGLSEAYAGIMIGKTGNVGTKDKPAAFGEGLFWVEATDVNDDIVQLESTGMSGGGKAKRSLGLKNGKYKSGQLGIFGGDNLNVQRGTTIDAYDSSLGTYAEQKAAQAADGTQPPLARVGSNGGILVN